MLEHPPELDRPVRPWLVTVMMNRWRMDRRSEARRRAREQAIEAPDPEAPDPAERAQALRRLGEAVEALAEPYRSLVIARYFDGKTSIQLAEELGIPAVTVRTRLLRALEKLRKQLDESAPRKKWMRALAPAPLGFFSGAKATGALLLFALVLVFGGIYYALPRLRSSSTTPSSAVATAKTSGAIRAETTPAIAPEPTAGQGRARVELVDTASGGAAGRIIDWSTGEGVVGAELTFTSEGHAVTLKTGEEGAFELSGDKPAAYALAQVTAPGYVPYSAQDQHSGVSFELAPGRMVRGLSVFLFPLVEYSGRVVDTTGAPVAGAKVTLTATSDDRVESLWTTDRDGRFAFHADVDAVLEAVAGERHGWAAIDEHAYMSKQITITVANVPGRDQTITGRVVDDDGKPLAGVLVGAYPQKDAKTVMSEGYRRSKAYAVSDANGAFEVRGLDREKYELMAEQDPRAPFIQKDVVGGTHGVDIKMSFGAELSGTVTDADGKGLPSFTVVVYQRNGAARDVVSARSIVDADGHFSLRLPPGHYDLLAAATGWAPSAITPASAPSSGVKVALSEGATVRGRVVSAVDGTPLSHARVVRESIGGVASALPANVGTVTRTDGTFELRGVPAGAFSLAIGADRFDGRIESGLQAKDGAEVGPLDFQLRPAGATPKTQYVGIGVEFTPDGDDLVISKVYPGGGAAAAGIVPGDHIASIDGMPVAELGEAAVVARIRGLPNTTLALGMRRAGSVVTLVITRARIEV